MTTYERQGGNVNVVVCDDGLQLLPEADAQARIRYYAENDLAFVARPPHGLEGFERRGKFKKAGNLNHANQLSIEIEEEMDKERSELTAAPHDWSDPEERGLYDRVRDKILVQREGKTWSEGNIRLQVRPPRISLTNSGEIILLIDSDTRVPSDCFLDASLEMLESPDVAIM